MKKISVKRGIFEEPIAAMDKVSRFLDSIIPRHNIDVINWKGYSYKPQVSFSIAYSDREIFLKYFIKEDYYKAEKTRTNEMVCEDSCVEFFVSPEDDGLYYNFEFNGIGTCLMGYGTGRSDNMLASPDTVSRIRRMTSRAGVPEKEIKKIVDWTLTIAIPFEVFFHHEISSLKGKTFRANFQKCGDNLSMPHFITWNPIHTPGPDFHRPEYFGLLKFI